MDITTQHETGDVAVLVLRGELDASNHEDVIAAARAARDGGARVLVVDLAGLTYMGSAGLVALHSAAILMTGTEPPSAEAGWDALHQLSADVSGQRLRSGLKLAGPTPQVDRVLERTGIRKVFDIHPDRATAVEAAAAS
jgi:anti-anti-sigma regulatory factor